MIKGLRPGTVLNFKYNNITSNIIATFMGHYWTHTAIVTGIVGDKVVIFEAMGTYNEELYGTPSLFQKFKFLMKIKKHFGGRTIQTEYNLAFLNKLHDEGRLKVMQYGIPNGREFQTFVRENLDRPYDYFSIVNIAVARVMRLLGKKYDNHHPSERRLFCSELVARGVTELTKYNMLELTNKDSYEYITPQDISLVYDRLLNSRYSKVQ